MTGPNLEQKIVTRPEHLICIGTPIYLFFVLAYSEDWIIALLTLGYSIIDAV